MDAIFHIIGLCTDNHSHIDLTDLLYVGGSVTSIILYIKMRLYGFFRREKNKEDET